MKNLLNLIENTIYNLVNDYGLEYNDIKEIELQGYAFCARSLTLNY